MRILLADDDPDLGAMLERALGRLGHAVDVARSGEDALWMASELPYDVLVLDVNLPPPDGFELCRLLRARQNWTPIIFLTGRAAVVDRVAGLEAGGDDYLVKPFALVELTARLRSLSRRQVRERPTVLRAGPIEIDPATRSVRCRGTDVELTPKEFALLELLVRHEGEVVKRSAIYEALWDFAFDPSSNVVESVVRRLRQKIERPFGRSCIETVRGVGYRLRSDG